MGGMGRVFAAWDPDLERTVALKLLREDVADSDAFKREFRAIADLVHPNVIRLHDLVREGEQWFFTMELVHGQEFHRHVSGSRARLRPALAQLADGLQALHDAGMAHGDVKSANVLVTGTRRVVLLDFGLSRRWAEELTDPTRSIRGTIAYLAPELVVGGAPTPESDWYSLGVMLYKALTGRHPFSGSAIEILYAKQHRDPVPARALAADAPLDLLAACDALLRRDPWSRPNGPELLEMLGERSAARARPRGTELPPPFVGRPEQLEALDQARRDCAGGATIALFLRGQPGVGKTALLTSYRTRASGAGALVLSGRCYERESIPYKGLDAAMAAFSRHLRRHGAEAVAELDPASAADLASLFPVFGWIVPLSLGAARPVIEASGDPRHRAVDALRRLLTEVSRHRSIVVAIDDLHWGDPDGATLLLQLLAAPSPPGILLVMAFRGDEAAQSESLRALWPGSWSVETRDLELAPLPHADAVALAHTLLGRDGDDSTGQAEAIARESGGNPHFLGELARLIEQRRRRGIDAPVSLPTVQEAIAERITGLPAEAQQLLRVISVAGEPFEPALASKAASLGEAAEAIDLLLLAKLIRMRQHRERTVIEPYHDRIREVAERVGDSEARGIHLALARLLEAQAEPDSERLATHFLAAGADAETARYAALAAARAAAAFAFDHAASLYAMALRVTAADAPGRGELQLGRAEALANAGRAHAAGRAFAAAAGGPGNIDELTLRLHAGDQLLRSGRVTEGLELFDDVLGRLGVTRPSTGPAAVVRAALGRMRVRSSGLRAVVRPPDQLVALELAQVDALYSVSTRLGYIDPDRAAQLHNDHVLAALRAGEPYRVVRALVNEAVAVSGFGDAAGADRVEEMLTRLERMEVPAEPLGHSPLLLAGLRHSGRGIASFNFGQWRRARAHLRLALDAYTQVPGTAWETMHLRAHLAWTLYYLGELEAFRSEIDLGLAEVVERDDLFGETAIRLTCCYRFLVDDDPGGSFREAVAAIERWNQPGLQVQHVWSAEHASQARIYQGRAAEGFAIVDPMVRKLRWSLIWRAQVMRLKLRYRRGSAAASAAAVAGGGERRAFLRAAEADMAALRRERSAVAAAYAAAIEAAIAATTGRDDAASLYDGAADRLARLDMVTFAASARRHAHELRGESTDAVDADLRRRGVVAPARFAAAVVPR